MLDIFIQSQFYPTHISLRLTDVMYEDKNTNKVSIVPTRYSNPRLVYGSIPLPNTNDMNRNMSLALLIKKFKALRNIKQHLQAFTFNGREKHEITQSMEKRKYNKPYKKNNARAISQTKHSHSEGLSHEDLVKLAIQCCDCHINDIKKYANNLKKPYGREFDDLCAILECKVKYVGDTNYSIALTEIIDINMCHKAGQVYYPDSISYKQSIEPNKDRLFLSRRFSEIKYANAESMRTRIATFGSNKMGLCPAA